MYSRILGNLVVRGLDFAFDVALYASALSTQLLEKVLVVSSLSVNGLLWSDSRNRCCSLPLGARSLS